MTIRGVVFDYGGVLLSYEVLKKDWAEMDAKHGLEPGTIAKSVKSVDFSEWCGKEKHLFSGQISVEEIENGLFTDFINEKYQKNISENLKPLSPLLEERTQIFNKKLCSTIPKLREQGIKCALLTNNFFMDQEKTVSCLAPGLPEFDVKIESCVETFIKPHEDIYKITSERLGIEPSQLLFLDDLQENCTAAENLGWKSILVNPSNEDEAVRKMETILGLNF